MAKRRQPTSVNDLAHVRSSEALKPHQQQRAGIIRQLTDVEQQLQRAEAAAGRSTQQAALELLDGPPEHETEYAAPVDELTERRDVLQEALRLSDQRLKAAEEKAQREQRQLVLAEHREIAGRMRKAVADLVEAAGDETRFRAVLGSLGFDFGSPLQEVAIGKLQPGQPLLAVLQDWLQQATGDDYFC